MTKKVKETKKEHGEKLVRESKIKKIRRPGVGDRGRDAQFDIRKGPLYAYAREGYTQRWVNDQYHNIDRALERGWTPRSNNDEEFEYGNYENCISRIIDRDGNRAILMEMPVDIYKSLKKVEQDEVDEEEIGHFGKLTGTKINHGGRIDPNSIKRG